MLPTVPATIVLAVLSITALTGLAEPVGDWNYDGVAYHLVGPKVWLHNGVVRPIADNMPTSYPSAVEVVFTALYGIGGDRAPGLSAAWTLAMLLAIAASLGRRCGLDARGASWVAALIVSMPAVYAGAVGSFVDAIYAAFILCAIRIGLDATEPKHFVALGILLGSAMATKYPALVALGPLVLCLAWTPGKSQKLGDLISNGTLAVAAACIVASPFYLKNWYFLGSPIYPPPVWVTNYLHVKYFPTDAIRVFYDYSIGRGNGHGRGLLHFFTLPFNLTFHTADFSGAGGIGLAPLAFAPFGVYATRRERFARRLALVGVLVLFLWFITTQESRYLIHFYAISGVFAVLGWQFIVAYTAQRVRLLCAAIVTISLAYGLFFILPPQAYTIRSVFSASVAKQRREKYVPWSASFDYINREPSVRKVLILDCSVLSYYSDKDYIKPFGQWGEQVYPDASTPAQILARLNKLHVSHILDVQSTISDFKVPTNDPRLELVFEAPTQRIYKVVSSN